MKQKNDLFTGKVVITDLQNKVIGNIRTITLNLPDGSNQIIKVDQQCKLSESEIERNLFGDEIVYTANTFTKKPNQNNA